MAQLFPSFNSCGRRMTGGERRFAHRLIRKLEDDYLCWYDVPLGLLSRHPDFVILHPRRGLLVVEVKDWKLETIKSADRASCTILTDAGQKTIANPLEQARQYAQGISDLLQKDPLLCVTDAGQYKGRLCLPYGYGVVFSNIVRSAFEKTDLGDVIDPHRVICQDEMYEEVDVEQFQERLWNMFTVHFKVLLSLPQIDRIRWHLFPEIRIQAQQLSLIEEPAKPKSISDTLPDLIQVMDLQQEQLARSLGEGHRVIHGVAGSGKTLILGYRCERLAPALQKPVLVLCYNRPLSAKLRHIIDAKRLSDKVNVRTFHAWCRDQLLLYHVKLPPSGGDEFYEALINAVIDGVERGQIPRAQYGAVMVDEGHDFQPDWLKLVAQMVDPTTNSLLVLYDDAQSIYDKKKKGKFTFSSLGIQAKGRTTILRLNYRNTAEVLAVAYEFAKDFITTDEAEEDGVPLIQPQSAGRRGRVPVLAELQTLKHEVNYVAKELKSLNDEGCPWRDMAVVYRQGFVGKEATERLREAGVPVEWISEGGAAKYDPSADSVKIVTMHGSKGLEFRVVAIPGLGYMPSKDQDAKEEARLLYVAMTRAMDTLFMTCHKATPFVTRIKQAQANLMSASQ